MKTIRIYFMVFSIILLTTSCEKYLEEVNKTQITSDLVYNDADQLESLVAASYAYLPLWYGKEEGAMLGDGGTDIWIDAKDAVGNLAIVRYLGLSADSKDFPIEEVWEYLYNAINVVNTAHDYIENSDELFTDERKSQQLSEVKFLRAFYYWHLVETRGPVPLKTTPTTAPSTEAFRDPIEDIYEQMFEDVQYGIDNMDQAVVPSSRVSYWAAKAFKARLALTYASNYYRNSFQADYKGVDYYAVSAQEAEDIINNNGHKSLADNYSDVWLLENSTTGGNQEFLWAVDYYDVIGSDNFANALPDRLQDDWLKTISRIVHESGGNGNAQHLWYAPRWNFNSSNICGPPDNDVLVRYYLDPSVGVNLASVSPATGNDTSYNQVFDVGTFYIQYGMGYVRCAPSRYMLELFDIEADQRWDATFRSAYYKHPQIALTGWPGPECTYPDMSMFTDHDTAFLYSNIPFTEAKRAYVSTRYKAIDIDTVYLPDGNYRTEGSDGTSDHMYPGLKKFEDTAEEQPELGPEPSSQFNNYFNYRDFPIFRISEMYLIAAEANLQSNPTKAPELINTLRETRAIPGKEAEMQLASVDLDKILEERVVRTSDGSI